MAGVELARVYFDFGGLGSFFVENVCKELNLPKTVFTRLNLLIT